MIVNGCEITAETEQACLEFMQQGVFSAMKLEMKATSLGVIGDGTAMRLADRLIQRERAAGRIEQVANRGWQCIKSFPTTTKEKR